LKKITLEVTTIFIEI